MDKFSDKTKRADLLVQRVLYEYGLGHKVLEARVFSVWEQAVGGPVASQTQPVALTNKRLTVNTISPVWKQELLFQKQHVLEKINKCLGESVVEELVVDVKPARRTSRSVSQRSQPSQRLKKVKRELDTSTLDKIDEVVSSVSDPELRTCLKNLFTKQSQYANSPMTENH